jgi:hypothetical protein
MDVFNSAGIRPDGPRDRPPLAGELERLTITIDAIMKVADELMQRLSPLLLAGPPFPPGQMAPTAAREKGPESQLSIALRERTERLENHVRWLAELVCRLDV